MSAIGFAYAAWRDYFAARAVPPPVSEVITDSRPHKPVQQGWLDLIAPPRHPDVIVFGDWHPPPER